MTGTAALGVDLETFAAVVRRHTLTAYNARSCIETVRVARRVGDYYGLTIEPVPVSCIWRSTTFDVPPDGGPPGHAVGVEGTGALDHDRNGWDGHLVGYLPHPAGGPTALDLGSMIDFSSDQFDRPARGLRVPGPYSLHALPRADLTSGFKVEFLATGTECWYQQTADRTWRRVPAWTARENLIRRVAAAAIRELREHAQ